MGSVPLVVIGGGVQLVGFGLCVSGSQSRRAARESPDEQSLPDWARAAISARARAAATWVRVKSEPLLRRLHLKGRRTVLASISTGVGLGTGVTGVDSIDNRDLPLEERLARLEGEVNELHRKASEHRGELARRGTRSSAKASRTARLRASPERARQLGRRLRREEAGLLMLDASVLGSRPWAPSRSPVRRGDPAGE